MAARTQSEIVINAPLDLVWDMTNDVENWPSLYGEYAKVEILERDGATIRFRLYMHPDPQGNVWSWISERIPDPRTRTVRARRIETGPFLEKMDMFWDYTQTPDGVRMRCAQEIVVRPDVGIEYADAITFLNDQTRTEMAHIKDVIEAAWAAQGS